MDEFEREFKSLPWRRASNVLRERIFGRQPRSLAWTGWFDRRISIRWAAVFVLAAGVIGHLSGVYGLSARSAQLVLAHASTELRIIETDNRHNFFDLTGDTYDILPGELTLNVQGRKEKEE